MHTLLIAALAVSMLPSPAAEACGDYGFRPRVFLLSSHGVKTATGWETRTFAVLGNAAPADAKWSALAPRTYDHSRIAKAPALEDDLQLTLVGPAGTRIVTSRSAWFLDSAWRFRKPSHVVEVSAGDKRLTVALAGRHADAAWIALDDVAATRTDTDWVTAQGVTAGERPYVHVARLRGTDHETVSVQPTGQPHAITFLRTRGQQVRRLDGHVLGGISLRGERFALVERDGIVTPVSI
jgi:hypothetical protein